jgi:hypothetical protein
MANFLGPPTFAMNLLHLRVGEGSGAGGGRPVEKGRILLANHLKQMQRKTDQEMGASRR